MPILRLQLIADHDGLRYEKSSHIWWCTWRILSMEPSFPRSTFHRDPYPLARTRYEVLP